MTEPLSSNTDLYPALKMAIAKIEEQKAEIERLRAALERIQEPSEGLWLDQASMVRIAREALRPADETVAVRGPYCSWCQGELAKPSPTCCVSETHAQR